MIKGVWSGILVFIGAQLSVFDTKIKVIHEKSILLVCGWVFVGKNCLIKQVFFVFMVYEINHFVHLFDHPEVWKIVNDEQTEQAQTQRNATGLIVDVFCEERSDTLIFMILINFSYFGMDIEKQDESKEQQKWVHYQTSFASPSEYSGKLYFFNFVHEDQSNNALRNHHDAVEELGQVQILRFIF